MFVKRMNLFAFFVLLFFYINANAQFFSSYKKQIEADEKKYKEVNPPTLTPPFSNETLGDVLQQIYELQAKNACQIIRTTPRLYIPKEIVDAYGLPVLSNTKIYHVPFSGENLLFLTLKPSDINKLESGKIVESEYIAAKRIVGISSNNIGFGQASLAPITGFPSLVYQKSCGSYFDGNATAQLKIPIAEMSTSLNAETKKSSLVTTVTGKFFSPLYLTLRQNTEQSVYMHLLLWELYLEQYKNESDKSELLLETGKYISEMNATLVHRATNSNQSFEMQGKLSAAYSAGIFGANGNIQTGYENKVSFSLKDFHTYVHRMENNKLSYELTNLPRYEDINSKLQNSTNFDPQSTVSELVSNLVPIEISRVLAGVPPSLCEQNSWFINDTGFDTHFWKSKPSVSSTSLLIDGKLPKCACKIKGYLTSDAISDAIKETGTIDLRLELTNKAVIKDKWLKLVIEEPLIKVTSGPRILQINSDLINATKSKTEEGESVYFSYPISFVINSMGVTLTDPIKISNMEIEYVNAGQTEEFNLATEPTVMGNTINVTLRTNNKPKTYVQEGERNVAIKITFSIQLGRGTTTKLVSNTFNLKMPNLIDKAGITSDNH